MVLQALMPGLKMLMATYRWSASPEDVATAVIEAAFERIRHYPCQRRPARVAANLLHDTREPLWRDACRERRLYNSSEPLTDGIREHPAPLPDTTATDELLDLVCPGSPADPPHPGPRRPRRGPGRRDRRQVADHPQAPTQGGVARGQSRGMKAAAEHVNQPGHRQPDEPMAGPGNRHDPRGSERSNPEPGADSKCVVRRVGRTRRGLPQTRRAVNGVPDNRLGKGLCRPSRSTRVRLTSRSRSPESARDQYFYSRRRAELNRCTGFCRNPTARTKTPLELHFRASTESR